ncbi:MAG: DUF393 domain-containing protein [Bryobacterales bacterium]|nr:DUF393 domain-containing protein [Bryobacterales bacterium]
MQRLFIVYDPDCGLCSQIKGWLAHQPAYLRLNFVSSGSPAARRLLPSLAPGDLAVVSDEGDAWVGDRAWVICLWALRDYRRWAARLARPFLLPFAERAFAALSRNRATISRVMSLQSDTELRQALGEVEVPVCRINQP